MNGIQTTSSLPLTLPQTTETPAAAPRADTGGVAVEIRAAAPQGPELSALNTAQNKADALRQANEAARRTVEGQTTYESKLADQRWQAAIAGGEQPAAERLNFQRGALTRAQDQARDMQTLNTQQLKSSLGALAQSGYVMSAEQKSTLQADIADVFADAPPTAREFAAPMLYTAPGAAKDMISDRELWEMISKAIGDIKDGYLGVYENVVAQYTEFYKAFSDILSQMANWIKPGGDGNKVKLDVDALKAALQKLKSDFSLPKKAAVLFPSQDKSADPIKGGSEEDARKWAKEMGLPDSCVQKSADGKWVVVIDMTPVDTMIRDVGALGSGSAVEMDNAKFQAWQSGFKAQEENLKNTLQTLTQKYSNANSLYDNLVKVLSSTISSCTETAKSFLQG